MTRRERLERKQAKREEWAGKADNRSTEAQEKSNKIGERFYMGQPILVDHHSGPKAKRDQKRMWDLMDKCIDEGKLAKHHSSKAQGIETILDNTIFSDDIDAIERLEERIAEREESRDKKKAINAAWRKAKGDLAKFIELSGLTEDVAQSIYDTLKDHAYMKKPYGSYEFSNASSGIRTDKKRVEKLKRDLSARKKAEENGGVNITVNGNYTFITFAEKPEWELIKEMKAAGMRYNSCDWVGESAKIDDIIALVEAQYKEDQDV